MNAALDSRPPEAQLLAAIEHAAHLLPSQGPIGVFVHHNTLHAFAHLPFETAVVEAAETFGAEPFMSEAWYGTQLTNGRISPADIDRELDEDADLAARGPEARLLGDRISRRALRRMLVIDRLSDGDDDSIQWMLEEQGLVRRFLPRVTAEACARIVGETRRFVASRLRLDSNPLGMFVDASTDEPVATLIERWLGASPSAAGLESAFERDPEACSVAALWAAVTRAVVAVAEPRPSAVAPGLRDTDEMVHAMLVPLCAAFLDQGVAYWPMADRELGFYAAVRRLLLASSWVPAPELRRLRSLFERQAKRDLSAIDAIVESLDGLGIPVAQWPSFFETTALALPGWAGMMRQLERDPGLAPHRCPPCSLLEFFAVRLVLDRWALGEADRTRTARASASRPERRRTPFAVFQIAQRLGISGPELSNLPPSEIRELLDELRVFDGVARRRLLHLAYERHHREHVLGALARHRQRVTVERSGSPSLQIAFCIDDRSESIRRHLEEIDPSIETFGAAGFFATAISFRGLDDSTAVALCPVVQRPRHEIVEVGRDHDAHARRRARRRLWSALARGSFVGSRSLVRGFVATFGFGLLSAFPLVYRVLFPRQAKRWRERLLPLWFPPARTKLALERAAEAHASLELFPGFTPVEMADRVERLLHDIGLVRDFAPIVATIGHGATTLNNPHSSAYDCGACGGRKGAPNARLFAQMANHPEVRRILAERGLAVPSSTWFVGGYHDTASDGITLFDLDEVPSSHAEHLARLRSRLDGARTRSAHERCRRFESASLELDPEQALRHVEARVADLGEPRPECGHATNAVCVFGRRTLTRGLFLDRRAFLVSYDPTIDPDAEILGRLLAAMGPVGAGINLEYYFSHVDNERYGCGTKLPHNVTGLLGVMNGHRSDLRTGLPWQMVEIHEPVRLLVVVESTPEALASVAERHPAVRELVENRWIQLALVDPQTGRYRVLTPRGFEPVEPSAAALPTVRESVQWYRGRRDHLPVAAVQAALAFEGGRAQ